MPTLVWVRRPKSGTGGAAAGNGGARKAEAASAAVPDPIVSADGAATAVPDSAQVALPAISSKRCAKAAEGGKKKRKMNRAKAGTAAKKRSKTCSERDLPRGVEKLPSGRFRSMIWCGEKNRQIGTFDISEEASAAYISARKELDDAKLSSCGADKVEAVFDEAKKKALDSFGGFVSRGVYKLRPGKFKSEIWWGGKQRYIGTFDTPEQASAAYISVRKDLDDAAKPSGLRASEMDAIFDAAHKKALEAVGACVLKKMRSKASPQRDLPRGVQKLPSGRFQSLIWWYDKQRSERDLPRGVEKLPSGRFRSMIWCGGKNRQIGTFDTPDQASAAYMSAKKDLADAKLSTLGADEANAAFDKAKKKALISFGV